MTPTSPITNDNIHIAATIILLYIFAYILYAKWLWKYDKRKWFWGLFIEKIYLDKNAK